MSFPTPDINTLQVIDKDTAAMAVISSKQKTYSPGQNSGYTRPELTSDFVFEHAHLLTQDQMARIFKIDRNTLMAHFGPDYHAGREFHPLKRKKSLERFLDQVQPDDTPTADWEHGYHHRNKEAKSREFLQALELWARWFSDLNKRDEVSEAPAASALSQEDLDAAIAEYALKKGWTPPKDQA